MFKCLSAGPWEAPNLGFLPSLQNLASMQSYGVSSHVIEAGFQLPCASMSWQEAREFDVYSQNSSCSYNALSSSEQELVSRDNYSLSCATGSSCVEILSPDNDSYRYLYDIPAHCVAEEMPCFLTTADTSIEHAAAFSDQISKSALEWHQLQYESLPGLLHVEIDPLVVSETPSADWNSSPSEALLSSKAKLKSELLEDICTPSGGGNNSSGCSAVSDVDTECTTMQSERRASALEVCPSKSNSHGQQKAGEPMGFPVRACNARTGDSYQLATACKRQRSCFTLEIVSESVHQHLQQHSGPLSCSVSNLSEAMLQLNEACAGPNDPLHVVGKPRQKDLGSSVEPQSIAARQRRKRISERVRELEKLVPGGNKLDTASMLDEAIKFVKFLQMQVQLLEAVGHGNLYNPAVTSSMVRRMFPFSSSDVNGSIDSLLGGPRKHSSPLVLSETLQHALFKHRRCIATIEQCRLN